MNYLDIRSYKCERCGQEKEGLIMPVGWMKMEDELMCAKCVKEVRNLLWNFDIRFEGANEQADGNSLLWGM